MKRSLLTLLLICLFGFESSSIIYRHDVDIKKLEALAAKSDFDCVGVVFRNNGSELELKGSCVLIDSQYVLSAAHVFMEKEYIGAGNRDTVKKTGRTTRVSVSYNRYAGDIKDYKFRFGKKLYNGKVKRMHPMYGSPPHMFAEYDLVVIKLEEVVPDIDPATLNDSRGEEGMKGICIGYGARRAGNKHGQSVMPGRRLGGSNTIDSLGGARRSGIATQMFADFDSPDTTGYNRIGGAIPLAMEVMVSGGDSGGGLFIQKDSKYVLAGVAKGVHVYGGLHGVYGSVGKWMRVSVFNRWIGTTINELELM